MLVSLFLLTIGCVDEAPEPDAAEAEAVEVVQADAASPAGLGIGIDVLRASLPPCEATPGDGTIDLKTGCAAGICADTTFNAMSAASSQPFLCPDKTARGRVTCETGGGISARFTDEDADGAADPETTANVIHLTAPFAGRTQDGLGMGVSMACVLDALGLPEDLRFEKMGDRYVVNWMMYGDLHLQVSDLKSTETGKRVPDGYVDRMALGSER
jgi:hypothetical protein